MVLMQVNTVTEMLLYWTITYNYLWNVLPNVDELFLVES